MTYREIEVVPYNPEWPQWFEVVKLQLIECIGSLVLSIDHIGSTSIPGLGETEFSKDHRPPLDSHSDDHWQKLFLSFIKKTSDCSIHSNIHFRIKGNVNQIYPLLFRDYLRSHPTAAAAYQQLKEKLAEYHRHNIQAYCELKDPACDLIMTAARDWVSRVNWSPQIQSPK